MGTKMTNLCVCVCRLTFVPHSRENMIQSFVHKGEKRSLSQRLSSLSQKKRAKQSMGCKMKRKITLNLRQLQVLGEKTAYL